MRVLTDAAHALDLGLAAIREQYHVPTGFPPEVVAAAARAAGRAPNAHTDLTAMPFVTLDPAASTDLDQALHIERAGNDLVLHYAIADVAWFVGDGDAIDAEAWERGCTLYLPDGKASLYPPSLAEGAASLLPDGPRPAVVFHVRIGTDGVARLDGATRSVVRSRAKLAYDTVTAADLPAEFADFARRVAAAEAERGAGKVDPPEQVVERDADGSYDLRFRPRLQSEDDNAALSLACNLAVAQAMLAAKVGLFRVMAEPDERAVRRLRHTAHAMGLVWPTSQSLAQFVRTLDGSRPRDGAFMLAVRRAGGGASYATYADGVIPWHAAMAATYAHATAPLRRLADRYVVQTALAIANGDPVPDAVAQALPRLTEVMDRADTRSSRIDRAVVDLAEAVVLRGKEGTVYDAVVTDDDSDATRIQLCDIPVVAKVRASGVAPGDDVRVKLVQVDPLKGLLRFERVG